MSQALGQGFRRLHGGLAHRKVGPSGYAFGLRPATRRRGRDGWGGQDSDGGAEVEFGSGVGGGDTCRWGDRGDLTHHLGRRE